MCDTGASLFCLINEINDSLKSKTCPNLQPSFTHLEATSQKPTESRNDVRHLPVQIALQKINHNPQVLVKVEADGLTSLDFLGDQKCDPLFLNNWK